jgi:hypothetical protein
VQPNPGRIAFRGRDSAPARPGQHVYIGHTDTQESTSISFALLVRGHTGISVNLIAVCLLCPGGIAMSRRLACAAAWSAHRAGRGTLPRDRRRTSNKDEHGPFGNHPSRITEPEERVLRRATPVARERAPTGAKPQPAATRRIDSHTQKSGSTDFLNPLKSLQSESGYLRPGYSHESLRDNKSPGDNS